ncbi:AAA family ATPase [Microbacterium sp. P5_E9]
MSRMIPATIADDAPPGEHAAFESLRDAPATDDWVVFHSLGIGRHVSQFEGEADFVVLAPGHGILVIEVKSHLRVQADASARWKLGNDDWTTRSPFQQASGEFHSIMEFLRQRSLEPVSYPAGYAVWFTAIARQNIPSAIGWHEWAVMDAADLGNAASAVRRVLGAIDRDTPAKKVGYRHVDGEPSAERVERIRAALSPVFDAEIKPAERKRRREGELLKHTADQLAVLDMVARARQVIVEGPAGTGKTYMAEAAARRHAAQGDQVLVVCFNRLLEEQLQEHLNDVDGVTVRRLHAEMERVAGVASPADGADVASDWYSIELPLRALDAATTAGFEPLYDYLVIDEAQDVATDVNLDFLDALLVGGLSLGRLLVLGDFSNQNIYKSGTGDSRAVFERRIPHATPVDLNTNCRNRRDIGAWAEHASGRDGLCATYRRDGYDENAVTVQRFGSREDEIGLLDAAVRQLRSEGYGPKDVVILAPFRDSAALRSMERKLVSTLGSGIRDASYVRWGTIHEFKGMEAPAVILTDISGQRSDRMLDLIYAGATRATDRLVVLTAWDGLG